MSNIVSKLEESKTEEVEVEVEVEPNHVLIIEEQPAEKDVSNAEKDVSNAEKDVSNAEKDVSNATEELVNFETIMLVTNEPSIQTTFQELFELFLNKNYVEFKLDINPEIHNYLLEFSKENSGFFIDVETSLKQIIMDNEITAKDIPDILCLIIKIYGIVKNKQYPPNTDPYDIIEMLVKVLLVIHLKQTNKNYTPDDINTSVEQIVSIVRISVELLKLPIIKMKKPCCLNLFKK
jgi:hypothetical protein